MNYSSSKKNIPQLGYFLKFRHWKGAINLLNYQLEIKKKNRHFNTLSMFYYEQLKQKNTKRLEDKKYFKNRVANNLFYGLEEEFAIHPYPIPKSNLGLRNYKFLTYPLRVLYYSIVLYLLDLSQELIREYYSKHQHIKAEYGGKLLINNERKLVLNYESIWYKPHYKRFRSAVRREIKDNLDNKIIIHIDIQNYYDEISIPNLLEYLSSYVKPSIQKELRFDAIAQAQIIGFFKFLGNGRLGIPQSDNDITSSYLGFLNLAFGDLLIDQEIIKYNHIVESHRIIRYMDDMYISVTFNECVNRSEREIYLNSLSARIADCLYEKLGLRLNTKTRLFWLDNEDHIAELLRNLKKVSPGYEIPDDEDKEHPNNKVERIFAQLSKLKDAPLDPSFDLHRDLESEILKEVYTTSVSNLLKKTENQQRIEDIFTSFNFDLIIAQPREILIVLLHGKEADKAFRRFLLAKRDLTSREVHLIVTYLCQTNFQSKKLIKLLRKSRHMQKIMEIYDKGNIFSNSPGYFDLESKQVLKLSKMHNVIEQTRLRVLSERQNQYSVALNHLLNEIHAICYQLDSRPIDEKRYDALKAVEFLTSDGKVPHQTCMKIRNLFDRRNKNPVSHADPIAWPVSKDEYLDYRYHVGICLSFIL